MNNLDCWNVCPFSCLHLQRSTISERYFFADHKKFCYFKSPILSPPYLILLIADITTLRVFLIVFGNIFYFLMSFCKCLINEIFDLVEKSYSILVWSYLRWWTLSDALDLTMRTNKATNFFWDCYTPQWS